MRLLWIYLAVYFLLLACGFIVLWQAGILERIPGVWLALAALVAIGSGVILAVASIPPRVRTGS